MNSDPYVEAYTQAFETMRYYGNLRFTVLTSFIIITGGLFTIALKNMKRFPDFWLPLAAGILIALAFGAAEWRIAYNFDFYGQKTEIIGQLLGMTSDVTSRPPNSVEWRLIAKVILELIYGGSLIMWSIVGWSIRKRSRARQQVPHECGDKHDTPE